MARLLLDSNALLWAVIDSPRLGTLARKRLIDDSAGEVYFSLASIWELAIKSASGKLRLDENLADVAEATGFKLLTLTAEHCWQAAHLPKHHADPVDRLMIAQALAESMTVMTSDVIFDRYGVSVMDATR